MDGIVRLLPGGYVDETGPHRGHPPVVNELLTLHRNVFREPMTGVELIAAERRRQIDVEEWTPEHDDKHKRAELINAAHSYIHEVETQVVFGLPVSPDRPPKKWPWEKKWWKPSDDPIRNLVKAGALLAAEIDRLQRAKDSMGTKP